MVGYIYSIVNKITGDRYVGKTTNITKRRNDHFNKLRNNKHINEKLQNAWNKYGEENFIFEYKEYQDITEEELNILEIQNIKKYNSYNNGYNLTEGGDGGNTRGHLSFEDYCFIYIGCQWCRMTDKISKFLNIDSSTVASILREKAYLWYKPQADNLAQSEKERVIELFRQTFGIPENKPYDNPRISNSLSEEEYFYCLCISSTYGRGIDAALGNFFGKHKSFLTNGMKNKTKGHAYEALQRFRNTPKEETDKIGQDKFLEWDLQKYSKQRINIVSSDRWRQ